MRFFGKYLQNACRAAPSILGALLLAGSALSTPPTAHAQDKPAAPKPPSDVVIFTNGDQLTGTVEHGAGNSIVFKSDMAGEITIPLDKVKELHSHGSFAVLRKDHPIKSLAAARAIAPGQIAYGDGKLTVEHPSAEPEVVPEAQIANIIDQASFAKDTSGKSGFRDGWNGSLNGGATIVRATDYGETYTAGIALVRAMPTVSFLPPTNRTTFDLQETYGKLTAPVIPQTTTPTPAAVTVTSIFHADAERDEYFSPNFFALAQTAFDHNYSQGLNLQQVYGGGIGWTAIKNGKQELDLKGTVQYEKQAYLASSGTPDQNIIGSTISEAYHRNLPRKLVFTESISALPAWNDTRDYSANGSVSLAMPVFKRLSLAVTTSDTFLNDPAFGYNKNSYQFVTAASYTLK
jgi:hypothetical protein